jgi:hypothetical protein
MYSFRLSASIRQNFIVPGAEFTVVYTFTPDERRKSSPKMT